MNIENTDEPEFSNGPKGSQATATPTKLQIHYLDLLKRLQNVKYSYEEDPGQEEWILQAIYKSSYAAFRSCVEHGVEEMAKSIIEMGHTTD